MLYLKSLTNLLISYLLFIECDTVCYMDTVEQKCVNNKAHCVLGYVSVASQIKSFWIPKWHFRLKHFQILIIRCAHFEISCISLLFRLQTTDLSKQIWDKSAPKKLIYCLFEQNQVVMFIPHVFINANASCLFKTVLYRHTPSALLGSFSPAIL